MQDAVQSLKTVKKDISQKVIKVLNEQKQEFYADKKKSDFELSMSEQKRRQAE